MSESTDVLLWRIQREFVEMPGLSLTSTQAARLLQLPAGAADALLQRLVDTQVLRVSDSGLYRRPGGA